MMNLDSDLLKKISEGFRPKIDEIVPDCYRELIEDCWSQDPKKDQHLMKL